MLLHNCQVSIIYKFDKKKDEPKDDEEEMQARDRRRREVAGI